jgi:hypothetical protein
LPVSLERARPRTAYCEGDVCAQVVWQASCTLEQLSTHAVLAVVLPLVIAEGAAPVVAALAAPAVAAPGAMGMRQVDWQVAAWELQVIMQVVVAEVCARRMPFAHPFDADVATAVATSTMVTPRMSPLPGFPWDQPPS